jgi:hypothetical protein
MKLIKKEMKIDSNTFAPVLEVTVSVPIELTINDNFDQDTIKKNIGAQFLKFLENNIED